MEDSTFADKLVQQLKGFARTADVLRASEAC